MDRPHKNQLKQSIQAMNIKFEQSGRKRPSVFGSNINRTIGGSILNENIELGKSGEKKLFQLKDK
jgi:hypothetical protein